MSAMQVVQFVHLHLYEIYKSGLGKVICFDNLISTVSKNTSSSIDVKNMYELFQLIMHNWINDTVLQLYL